MVIQLSNVVLWRIYTSFSFEYRHFRTYVSSLSHNPSRSQFLCMSDLSPSLIHHALYNKHISQNDTSDMLLYYRTDMLNAVLMDRRTCIRRKIKFTPLFY